MNKKLTYLFLALLSITELNAQTCNMYIGGYIPSYRNPSTVDYSKLSHVFYAFAKTNAGGDILVDNPTVFNTFKTASTGKQRYISLGGAGDVTLPAMSVSSTARQTFVSNCVAFCQTHNLQGADMDWEGIRSVQDSTNFGLLMRELASGLHANGLKLIATIGYGSYSGEYYSTGTLKAADWIQLMVYDQTGTWPASPYGNHASYQHMLDAITYWTGRGYTNTANIVIGLPFYGYKFNSTQGGMATALTYSEIANAHPSLSCNQDEVSLKVFNGPQTIREKVVYVKEQGLKGVMIWEMGQDLNSNHEKSLLRAVSEAACDEPASCPEVITALEESSMNDAASIFSNPVKNILLADLKSLKQDMVKIELISNSGIMMFATHKYISSDRIEIDVSDLPPGFYHIRLKLTNNLLVVKKIVKL